MREYMWPFCPEAACRRGAFANALAMAAGSPRRIAVAAVAMACANAMASALPWLFTTTPVSPTMQAPL